MMEFEDEERDEEEEEEEDDDDDDEEGEEDNQETMTLLSPPPFKTSDQKPHPNGFSRYRECLKNHAVTIGGHALDGCGEFMPAGPDGTLDSLKCAACNCHRNFHRKEFLLLDPTTPNHQQLTVYTPRPHQTYHPPPPPPNPNPPQVYQFYPYNRTSAAPGSPPLALPSPAAGGSGDGEELMMTMRGKKRHRTKFSQEQKDKMLGLAERLGWRIQKQDETVVQHFCEESGIKRHVLKVWMHNNKNTLGKKPLPIPS